MTAIAYLVMAHAPDEQLRLQIRTLLEDERSIVYLHLDAKTRDHGWLGGFAHPRFHLLQRYSVNWAGFSIVRATRLLLAAALSNEEIGKFALLSGACFPLLPIGEVNRRLSEYAGSIFAIWGEVDPHGRSKQLGRYVLSHYYPYDIGWLNPRRGQLRHLLWTSYSRFNRLLRPTRRPPAARIWKGSMFFVADRALAAAALADQSMLEEALRYAHAPDELFFQSLYGRLLERDDRAPTINDELDELQGCHFIRRTAPRRGTLQRIAHVADERKLRPDDVADAMRSRALFARKCDLEVCKRIVAAWESEPTSQGGAQAARMTSS